MAIDLNTIKLLTKKLASINLEEYDSLSKVKSDFDSIAVELIDIDSNDTDLIESLNKAAEYFNLLEPSDFNTNDFQKINESHAIISKFTRELNVIIVKWRKELGQL